MKKRRKTGLLWAALLLALLLAGCQPAPPPDVPTIPYRDMELEILPGVTASGLDPAGFALEEDGRVVYESGGLRAKEGIDVSFYQKEIDWEKVAADGVDFALVRLGYRGYSEGALYEDELAAANLDGAKAAGLKIGAYFFSQAVNVHEARAEAEYALELLDGIALDLPLAYDWEYVNETARTATVSKETLTACTVAFCQAVKDAGRKPMIYFNRTQAMDMLELDRVAEFDWWLAQYQTVMDFPYRVAMWQYTKTGSVPGISGDVDINVKFEG